MYYCSFFPGFDHLHGREGMLPPAWTFFSCCDIRKGSRKSVSIGTGKSKGCLHNCQSKIFKVAFYFHCCTCNARAGFRNHYQVCMEIHFMWCRLFPHSCEQRSLGPDLVSLDVLTVAVVRDPGAVSHIDRNGTAKVLKHEVSANPTDCLWVFKDALEQNVGSCCCCLLTWNYEKPQPVAKILETLYLILWLKWPVHDLVLVIHPPPPVKVASNARPCSEPGGTTMNGGEGGGECFKLSHRCVTSSYLK